MGVNYRQYCMLGIKVTEDECLKVISPAIYADEPRFDTKTGKQVSTEKVLREEADEIYKWRDFESYYFGGLSFQINNEYINTEIDAVEACGYGSLYIGVHISSTMDCGRVELLEGEVSLEEIEDYTQDLIQNGFGRKEIGLHFFGSVG